MGLFGLNQRQLGHMLHGFGQGVTNIGQTLSRKKELEEERKRQEEQDAKRAKERRKERLSDRDFQLMVRGTDAETKRIEKRQERRDRLAAGERTIRANIKKEEIKAGVKRRTETRTAEEAEHKRRAGAESQKIKEERDPEWRYQEFLQDRTPNNATTAEIAIWGAMKERQMATGKTTQTKQPVKRNDFESVFGAFQRYQRDHPHGQKTSKEFLAEVYIPFGTAYDEAFPGTEEAPGVTDSLEQPGDNGGVAKQVDVNKSAFQHQQNLGAGRPAAPSTGRPGLDVHNYYVTQLQQQGGMVYPGQPTDHKGFPEAHPYNPADFEPAGEEDGVIDITDAVDPTYRIDPERNPYAAHMDELLIKFEEDTLSPEEEQLLEYLMQLTGLDVATEN